MASRLDVLEQAGLRLDADGAIATVTLNRPERRNAMSPSMWHGLAAIGDALPDLNPGRHRPRCGIVLFGRHRPAPVHPGRHPGGGTDQPG